MNSNSIQLIKIWLFHRRRRVITAKRTTSKFKNKSDKFWQKNIIKIFVKLFTNSETEKSKLFQNGPAGPITLLGKGDQTETRFEKKVDKMFL